MDDKNPRRLSRRNFLKACSVFLGGSLFPKLLTVPFIADKKYPLGPKRIYIAADDHTDYMWIADEDSYRLAFLEMIDYYLNLADSTASNPSEFQSRWNCDGSFWIWTFEQNRTAEQFNRLIYRIRDGHISFPLNTLVSCLGGAPIEAVLRGLYYSGEIERRYDLRIPIAICMENQTLPYGLSALWAGAGAKYSWKGICGCASKVEDAGDREQDIYWWMGPDGSKILMKWNSMLISNQNMGGYAEARNPAAIVDYVDTDQTFINRYPYQIIGAFGKGWDDFKTLSSEFVTVAINKTNINRSIIVSNQDDFFKDFETTYGNSLPVISASFGNEWDLYCASMAEVSAQVKRSIEKLRPSEALAVLVSLKNPDFLNSREVSRRKAWIDIGLYWEHAWTADGPISRDKRRDWQRGIANEIRNYVDTLHSDAVKALGSMILKTGSQARFYVYNPLGWERTDVAEIPFMGSLPFHVIDLTTHQETPSQIVTTDGERRLLIVAQNVPAVGYKVFEIQPGSGNTFPQAAMVTDNVIENQFYRVTVAGRGAITSLIDKTKSNREFVRIVNNRAVNDLGPGQGFLEIENSGPVSVTLLATSPNPLAHTSRLTFVRNSQRIDIRNDISQNFSDIYTWSFGFDLPYPDVWHEEVGAVIRAKLKNQGGHYSPRNARYDWLTLNHFADINSNQFGVTLSNSDCYFMRLGESTPDYLDTITPQISVLSGGQVDGVSLGIPNQGGDTHFLQRFSLQTHSSYDPVRAMRFALEHQNSLVTGWISGGSSYPETYFSLLNISNPNVLLWALKPAEDGIHEGAITRFWNLSNAPINFYLSNPSGSIAEAKHLTHIETPIESAEIRYGDLYDTLNPQQLKTYSIRFSDLPPINKKKLFLPIEMKE